MDIPLGVNKFKLRKSIEFIVSNWFGGSRDQQCANEFRRYITDYLNKFSTNTGYDLFTTKTILKCQICDQPERLIHEEGKILNIIIDDDSNLDITNTDSLKAPTLRHNVIVYGENAVDCPNCGTADYIFLLTVYE